MAPKRSQKFIKYLFLELNFAFIESTEVDNLFPLTSG